MLKPENETEIVQKWEYLSERGAMYAAQIQIDNRVEIKKIRKTQLH